MFDTLVESKTDTQEAGRKGAYLGVTALLYGGLFLALLVWSLYSFDVGFGEEDLVLDTLVAPVPVPEPEPPPPPDEQPKEQPKTSEKPKENVDVLQDPTQRLDQVVKEPPPINVARQQFDEVRKGVQAIQGEKTVRASGGDAGESRGGGTAAPPPVTKPPVVETDEPPPPPPTPKPTPKPVPKTISGGVVNSKATNLVKPPYPAAARAVRAAGAVNVQVTIDESGNVISASATSGHPLLRAAAVQAARSSKFSPTLLSGQAVKVTGVIVYNFNP
jgi:TonB family protein